MKSKRQAWHNLNRIKTGQCCRCGFKERIQIHHKNYHPIESRSIYDYTYDELKKFEVVEPLCKKCHLLEHFTNDYQEFLKNRLKHTGYCKSCNKLAIKGWTRALTYNIDYPICKKCSRSIKDKSKVDKIVKNNGQQFSLFN